MEIARLEVSTQRHIDRMQEMAKVNYVQFGKNRKFKPKPGKFQQMSTGGGSSGSSGNPSKSSGKGRKFHYLQTFAGVVAKADTRKDNHAKQWKQCAGIVPSKDTLRKSV